jgi:hypothetical protein
MGRTRVKLLTLIIAILVVSSSASADKGNTTPATGQWTIVASNETSPNTIDGGPLQIITDWTSNGAAKSLAITPVLANTFTNSTCSASGQPAALMADVDPNGKPSVVVTLDNGQQVVFSGTNSGTSSQFSGTFTSTGGGCTQADSGNFTATLYQPLLGSITGTVQSYAGTNSTNVTMNLSIDSNFNVTGTVKAANKPCMANLTINGPAAQAYGPSFASGDTETILASDNSGNVVGFVISATDANGNFLFPPWPSQMYVTYDVVAGTCSGDAGTDAPFHQVQNGVKHAPIRRPIRRGPQHGVEFHEALSR